MAFRAIPERFNRSITREIGAIGDYYRNLENYIYETPAVSDATVSLMLCLPACLPACCAARIETQPHKKHSEAEP